MNPYVFIGVVVVMIGLRFTRLHLLGWLLAWGTAIYLVLRFGITPPLPASVLSMFMGIILTSLVIYATSSSERSDEIKRPLVSFMIDARYTWALLITVILLPAVVALNTYISAAAEVQTPVFARTIHPAPPGGITYQGQAIDLAGSGNPYRGLESSDIESFRQHVANGRRVYYEQCVFCHGDNMKGDGIFAHALDPIPANFADATTIAMLQESYLFWRIAKGGPGLPVESAPWASAMPAWEKFLTADEIWDVILFLYDYTDQKPRAREDHT